MELSEVGMSLDFLHGACAESQAFLGHQELIILDYSILVAFSWNIGDLYPDPQEQ